ncbi:MAG: LVIVD repeat-containing protein [Chitinophagaceae bacterium]
MKRMHLLILCTSIFFFNSCLKDSSTYSYKVYRPIVKPLAEVRKTIKQVTAIPVSSSGKILLYNQYILLSSPGKGVHIINNSNPQKPVNELFISIPGCIDIALTNDILYADCYSDLLAINIKDFNNVKIEKIIPNLFPDRRMVNGFVVDTSMAIVDWEIKDTTISNSNSNGYWMEDRFIGIQAPGNFFMSAAAGGRQTVAIAGSMARFAIQNQHLYTVSTNTLSSLNIRQAAMPKLLQQQNIGWDIETIYPFKDKLFIGSQTGMFIYDVTTPGKPTYVSGFSHARVCDPVIADDSLAYVTLRSGSNETNNNNGLISLICTGNNLNELNVVDIKNIQQPKLAKTYQLRQPHGLSKDGNILFICDGDDGVKLFNAANPYDLQLLQTIPIKNSFDVICYNGVAVIVASSGIYQYAYSATGEISFLSRVAY